MPEDSMIAEVDDVTAFARRDDMPEERAPKRQRGARRLTRAEAIDSLRRLAALPRYPTPFPTLNQAVGLDGHIGGQVMVLIGGTGIGKTTMLLAFANHFAIHHGPVLFVTVEMAAGHCIARGAAPYMGVTSNQLLKGEVTILSEESTGISDRIQWVEQCSLLELRESVEDMTRENGGRSPLVIIDYLQRLSEQVMATMERPDMRLATSQVSTTLTAIARDFHAPILAVSTTSRFGHQRIKGTVGGGKAKDPRTLPPGDLVDVAKETGSIEYDAANVLVANVSDDLDVDGLQIATLTVAKARYGRTQHIAMAYDGAGAAWYDRGRVEPKAKDEPVNVAQITAERAAELNALSTAIVKLLEFGPASVNTICAAIKRRRTDIVAAVRSLQQSGAVVERGGGSTRRLHLTTSQGELPMESDDARP